MTRSEQNIYNTHLRVSRTKRGLPYRLRKQFHDFEKSDPEKYVQVKKLGMFFAKFPNISVNDFFSAPYDFYQDQFSAKEFYELHFYLSPKAIKVYSWYIKKKEDELPDSPDQIEFIKQSLMFIFVFCRDNNMNINDYLDHKTNNLHTFILHIKHRNVSLYTLFGLPELTSRLDCYSKDQIEFTLGENFIEKLAIFRTRLYNSKNARLIVIQGTDKIKKLLQKIQNNI